jgi:hypothetical protein
VFTGLTESYGDTDYRDPAITVGTVGVLVLTIPSAIHIRRVVIRRRDIARWRSRRPDDAVRFA